MIKFFRKIRQNMIKENKVLKKVTIRSKKIFEELGYDIPSLKIGEYIMLEVKISDLPETAKDRVTAVCELCGSENNIGLYKYYINVKRNDKGYYSCFKCKNVEKEKQIEKKKILEL